MLWVSLLLSLKLPVSNCPGDRWACCRRFRIGAFGLVPLSILTAWEPASSDAPATREVARAEDEAALREAVERVRK